jgi:hypothetical protein
MQSGKTLSSSAYKIIGWIFTLLIIFAVFALIYVIIAPHRIEARIEKRENKLICQDNMYRLALAEEKHYRDKGEYTTKKVYLLAYDEDADQLRCPTTGILYEIDLETINPDYGINDFSLKNMEEEDVPDRVITKLEEIKGQKFSQEDEFAEKVESLIGERDSRRYKDVIVEYGETEPDTVYTTRCPRPETGEYPNHGTIIKARPSWKAGRMSFAEERVNLDEIEDEEEKEKIQKERELREKLRNSLFFRAGSEKDKGM